MVVLLETQRRQLGQKNACWNNNDENNIHVYLRYSHNTQTVLKEIDICGK